MRTIELKQLDELEILLSDFGVLTYLQSLVQYEKNGPHVVCESDLDVYRRVAEDYLWDRQHETLIRFKELLHDQDFTKSIDESREED